MMRMMTRSLCQAILRELTPNLVTGVSDAATVLASDPPRGPTEPPHNSLFPSLLVLFAGFMTQE